MDKLKKVNIWRFVEGLGLDLKRKQLIGKLIEEIVDASIEGVPAASNDNIGGIKTGYTQTGKNYPVALDKNKKAYVNVPWSDTNTTYEVMTGATASAAGQAGLVPAPGAGKQGQYLRGDGQWLTPPNTTYSVVTTSANGLMSKEDKVKLNGVAENANNYSLPAATSAALGGVKQGAAVAAVAADADAATIAAKVNELIASLKAAGVIA